MSIRSAEESFERCGGVVPIFGLLSGDNSSNSFVFTGFQSVLLELLGPGM